MTDSEFKELSELTKLGRLRVAGSVPDESRQSLPMLVRNPAGGLFVRFFFAPALARPQQPVRLAPPHYVATLDAKTGELLELQRVHPSEFNQKHAPADEIGTFGLPKGVTFEDFTRMRSQMDAVGDLLAKAFVRKGGRPNDAERQAAGIYLNLFDSLAEPPLLPYYEFMGREFLPWVREVAR